MGSRTRKSSEHLIFHLNSGSAHDNPARPTQLEFNVRLDPAAYAAMFDLPCPLFWFPCWHVTETRESGPSGSFYWLPHREALSGISDVARYPAAMTRAVQALLKTFE